MALRLSAVVVLVGLCVAARADAQVGSSSRAIPRPLQASADPRAELLSIGAGRFGPDGRVYIEERQHLDIRVFDAGGKFVGNVGRSGGGPGEFRRISGFGWIGDTLWVVDQGLRRFTLFDRTHRVIRSFSSDVAGMGGSHVADVLTAAGRLTQFAPSDRNAVSPAPILRISREGKLLDTLADITYGHLMVRVETPAAAGRGAAVRMLLQTFADQPLWDVDPTGRWLAVAFRMAPTRPAATRTEVRLYDLKSGTSRTLGMPFTPVPVTRAMLDTVFASYAPVPEGALRQALFLPSFLPPIRSVIASDDGGVWLQRQDGLTAGTWIRLDNQGALTDVVRIPAAYAVADARGRELLAVIREPDDVQPPVVIYSIVK